MANNSLKSLSSCLSILNLNESSSIENLLDDLLVQFIVRLSCKSCVKCKLVLKRWLALISRPYFVVHFLRRKHHQLHQYCSLLYHSRSLLISTKIPPDEFGPLNGQCSLNFLSPVHIVWKYLVVQTVCFSVPR
ncbi:F-box protein [Quillaja saponaria]|uniref:F-box protein n=1 Tax=Quillaja saponaria TaxID=32244 RepID=A0AAD7L0T1_QUISA|nr:F-box protein [Quillaja saponaria]